jgi:hypothetical protein
VTVVRRPTREPGPDLFEVGPAQPPATLRQPEPKLILPDLEGSLAILTDSDLERLLSAVTREANSRGKKAKSETPTPQKKPGTGRAHTDGITAAKANLVRAAFKAGVRPTAIARQFGLSQAVVRQVLKLRLSGR